MIFRSRAPVRIDFAGGWSDVALFCEQTPGYVLGAAISLYSYAMVKQLPRKTNSAGVVARNEAITNFPEVQSSVVSWRDIVETHKKEIPNNGIKIYSTDFDIYQAASDIKDLEYDGSIDLIKAAVKKTCTTGIEIITRCDAPAGAGLGSSASMGVALCGVIASIMHSEVSMDLILPYEFAEYASEIERVELGILGGKQDQYLSAYGGINFMEFNGEEVRINKLPLAPSILMELEKHLVLCYTGQSRLSSDIHEKVVKNFKNGEQHTLNAISELKRIALEMKVELIGGNFSGFAELMSANWESQKQLDSSVTNPFIDAVFNLAMDNGAAGGKACGAGGGGCLVFYCPDTEHIVRKKLQEKGMQIIDFTFDFDGLQTWSLERK